MTKQWHIENIANDANAPYLDLWVLPGAPLVVCEAAYSALMLTHSEREAYVRLNAAIATIRKVNGQFSVEAEGARLAPDPATLTCEGCGRRTGALWNGLCTRCIYLEQ